MRTLATLFLLTLLTGCSTVRYARLLPLTTNERAKFTCEELDNEIADAVKFKTSVGWHSETTGEEVAGILGDFGIGNAMERSAAVKSADIRIESCRAAKKERACPLTADEEAEAAALAVISANPAFGFASWHAPRSGGIYHTNRDCPAGRLIPMDQRIEGAGPNTICLACRRLDSAQGK